MGGYRPPRVRLFVFENRAPVNCGFFVIISLMVIVTLAVRGIQLAKGISQRVSALTEAVESERCGTRDSLRLVSPLG